MASVTKEPQASVDSMPIDTVTILAIADQALAMSLSTSTREDIDLRTTRLIGCLGLLLAEDLGAEQDEDVLKLFQMVYKHLDLPGRPSRSTPTFAAFEYMTDTATFTKAVLKAYAKKNEISLP
ncbi:hypothetical protein [Streptomyces graminilatus]|uniref:hypothetical protein n=1 Tax=Streptomyces graminilatus TaxID=1464070 RepID=UPI0006E32C79|nr:hypothetical protein [Streptomyces graminilatus]